MAKKLTLNKSIELLKNASYNKLTEDTIKNLAKNIRKELILEERYEECATITKIEAEHLLRFKTNKNQPKRARVILN